MTALSFAHVMYLSDDIGIFEHAEGQTPRMEHGYCVDDVARALIVIAREPHPHPRLQNLAEVYLRFLIGAVAHDGSFRNRRDVTGRWTDEPAVDDHWGRALWGLGTVAARMPSLRRSALGLFNLGARRRSPWLHSMAFAALGAAEVLAMDPANVAARNLLRATVERMQLPRESGDWLWPESRLTYANGAIPEVLIRAGALLHHAQWVDDGVRLLDWLLQQEIAGDHLSVTPVGGWQLGDPRPGFDQQPVEVAAIADACNSAYDVTGGRRWLDAMVMCAEWFDGRNDVGVAMADHSRGAGFDGLERHGRNENQGAESTLALLSTMQASERLLVRV